MSRGGADSLLLSSTSLLLALSCSSTSSPSIALRSSSLSDLNARDSNGLLVLVGGGPAWIACAYIDIFEAFVSLFPSCLHFFRRSLSSAICAISSAKASYYFLSLALPEFLVFGDFMLIMIVEKTAILAQLHHLTM